MASIKGKKTSVIVLSFVIALVLASVTFGVVSAAPVGQDGTPGTNVTYTNGAGSEVADGGNITQLNFTGIKSTTNKWQGYYGTVAGSITLANAGGTSELFNWPVSTLAGEVFATQNNSMTLAGWRALAPKTGAIIDNAFGFVSGDSDSATNTFDEMSTQINISGTNMSATTDARATTLGGAGWETIALAPASETEANFVFAGVIKPDAAAYDTFTVNYQMIVPVTEGTTDTYYFYVELT